MISILAGSTLSFPRTPAIFLPISSSRENNSRNNRTAKFMVDVDLDCKAMRSSREMGKFKSSGKDFSVILAISSWIRCRDDIPGRDFEALKDFSALGSDSAVISSSLMSSEESNNCATVDLALAWILAGEDLLGGAAAGDVVAA